MLLHFLLASLPQIGRPVVAVLESLNGSYQVFLVGRYWGRR